MKKLKLLIVKKILKKGCNNKSIKCITHNLWDKLDNHINGFFENVKLEELIKKIMSDKIIDTNKEYKYGFTTDIESFKAPKGLSEETIKFISKEKRNQNGC